jgi:hypothetical protein
MVAKTQSIHHPFIIPGVGKFHIAAWNSVRVCRATSEAFRAQDSDP